VLGERFPLFPPEATVQQRSVDGIMPVFQSLLTLDTDDLLPPLPFQLSTSVWPKPFHDAYTPFEPDAGYHLSREDYDPAIRPLLRHHLIHDFTAVQQIVAFFIHLASLMGQRRQAGLESADVCIDGAVTWHGPVSVMCDGGNLSVNSRRRWWWTPQRRCRTKPARPCRRYAATHRQAVRSGRS